MEMKPFLIRWPQHSFQRVAASSGNIPEQGVAAYVIVDERQNANKNSMSIKNVRDGFISCVLKKAHKNNMLAIKRLCCVQYSMQKHKVRDLKRLLVAQGSTENEPPSSTYTKCSFTLGPRESKCPGKHTVLHGTASL